MAKDKGATQAFMKRTMGAEKAGTEAMQRNRKSMPAMEPAEKLAKKKGAGKC